MSRSLLLAAALTALAFPALAQEATATARNAPPLDASANTAPAPLDAPRDVDPVRQVVKIGPCTPQAARVAAQAEADGAKIEPDRAPHGEVGAGIGTNGYREVHGTVCKPIGDDGFVSISAGKTEWGGRRH
ncbi:MAG: hypothetical protein JSR45_04095 [Proteobacteria bacterium]|nr:hypothetical protein [Pseudomonadota bacterium]